MSIDMDCFGLSDVGRLQRRNEDQFLIADLIKSMRVHQSSVGHAENSRVFGSSQGKLLVVADGKGGIASGDRASTIMIDSITSYVLDPMRWVFQLADRGHRDFRDDLKAAVTESNQQIQREIAANPKRDGMRTTVTLAYLIWPTMHIVHLGDSRCYRYRDSTLAQITRDGNEPPRTSGNVHASAWENLLHEVIGEPVPAPTLCETRLQLGDKILLCTDGLTKHATDAQISAVLSETKNAQEACQQLIALADRQGGSDNVTVVVASFDPPTGALAHKAEARGVEAGNLASEPTTDFPSFERRSDSDDGYGKRH